MFTKHKDAKPFLLGIALGAGVLGMVGFSGLGWMTSGKAAALAKQEANNAVTGAHASICVAQFNSAKDAPEQLAKLQTTERWSRGDVVTKGGWATMPGSKEPGSGVGQACADLLIPEKG
jgi:hypothetical protein